MPGSPDSNTCGDSAPQQQGSEGLQDPGALTCQSLLTSVLLEPGRLGSTWELGHSLSTLQDVSGRRTHPRGGGRRTALLILALQGGNSCGGAAFCSQSGPWRRQCQEEWPLTPVRTHQLIPELPGWVVPPAPWGQRRKPPSRCWVGDAGSSATPRRAHLRHNHRSTDARSALLKCRLPPIRLALCTRGTGPFPWREADPVRPPGGIWQ